MISKTQKNLKIPTLSDSRLLHSMQFYKIVKNTAVYFILIALSVVYLAPFFYMIGHSLMSTVDWLDPEVNWLPRTLYFDNYGNAVKILNYWPKLFMSLGIMLLSTLGQIISCSFVGYGLARIKFFANPIISLIVVFTMIIPPQVIIVPQFLLFSGWNMIDTYWPIILPCFFAMGLNGGLFIFIFRQFFKGMPNELENAALIDGAGVFGAFFRVMLPNVAPGLLVSFILSIIWQWNNSFEPSIYIREPSQATLTLQLHYFQDLAKSANMGSYSEGVVVASTVLIVLPIIIIFFVLQRKFMQSIEMSGLAN